MGVTTSFFVTTKERLAAAAPGWIEPRYGAFSAKEIRNPFTGQTTVVKQHELLVEPPAESPPETIHQLVPRDRPCTWKLTGIELESLMALVTNASDDKLAELTRRALIGPDDSESWVFEIPDLFVEALAKLTKSEIPSLASKWQVKLEWPEPPTTLLEQLATIASEAKASDQRMFSYVSL